MNLYKKQIKYLVIILFSIDFAFSQETTNENVHIDLQPNNAMKLDSDGILEANEFEYVSRNESITRALCPYDCKTRNLPEKFCRAWKSIQDPKKCYAQDIRLKSEAINLGKPSSN